MSNKMDIVRIEFSLVKLNSIERPVVCAFFIDINDDVEEVINEKFNKLSETYDKSLLSLKLLGTNGITAFMSHDVNDELIEDIIDRVRYIQFGANIATGKRYERSNNK